MAMFNSYVSHYQSVNRPWRASKRLKVSTSKMADLWTFEKLFGDLVIGSFPLW